MIPTFKAKKIDSDEWVEGFYGNGISHDIIHTKEWDMSEPLSSEIDLLTLQISFDGENWNSIEEVKCKLMFADRNKWILGA